MMISMAVTFLVHLLRQSLLMFALYHVMKVGGNDIIRLESNNTLPEEGNSVRLSCLVQDSTDNPITWFHNNVRAGMCYRSGPFCFGAISGLSITADQYGSYMDIARLQRTSHQGNYTCTFATSGTQLFSTSINIIVYAIPQGLINSQQPTTDTDLIASSVTLQCQTDGCTYPAIQIRWYYLDQNNTYREYNTTSRTEQQGNCTLPEKIYTSQLNISRYTTWSDNSDKSVVFACGVEYPNSSRKIYSPHSKTVRFAVNVAEVTLVASGSGTVVFYEGFPQSLRCTSSPSRPVSTIRWWLGIRQLTDNFTNLDITDTNSLHVQTSSISLALARDSRNQKIFCDGFISGQITPAASSQLTVDVWYKPNKPEVQEYGSHFPWLENQTGILQCYGSNYGNPNSSVMWTSDIGAMDQMSHLVLKELLSSDNGKAVFCQLVNNYTIEKNIQVKSETRTLNVEYFPVIEFNSSSFLTVNETQSIGVLCSARGNPNPNTTRWRRRPTDSILRFDNISRVDTGTYICEAAAISRTYGQLKSQRPLDILVQYAPDVNVISANLTQENMSSSVRCEVKGVPAQYIFHPWKHLWGDVVIRSDLQGTITGSTISSHNTLILESLSLQDMGTYICSADNRIKGINGDIVQNGALELKVTGTLSIIREDSSLFFEEVGRSINIYIPFYSYPAIQEFVFQKNGTAVTNTSRTSMNLSTAMVDYKFYGKLVKLEVQVAHLFIQNLSLHDFENYTLVLTNSMRTKEFKVQVDAAGPPHMIDRFYFNRFIENQIEMHFDPGFNGGRVQTFLIEYRSTTRPDTAWRNSGVTDLIESYTTYQLSNGTYVVNVTQPSPGNYEYRMYSWNEIGRGPYSKVITVFIPEEIKIQEQASPKVAEIVGGIVAAVVVIAVVTVVLVFIKRRNKSNDKELKREQQKQSFPMAGPEYINTAFRSDITTTEYETLQLNKKETSPYESLSVPTSNLISSTDIRPSTGETFCNIHPYEDNQGHTYSSQSSKKHAEERLRAYQGSHKNCISPQTTKRVLRDPCVLKTFKFLLTLSLYFELVLCQLT